MARLLDTAVVNPDDGKEWRLGYSGTARECHVQVEFAEACDDTYIALVGDETSTGPGQYKVAPFPLQAFLRQSVFCQEPDDGSWFSEAFSDIAELALTRALVIQPVAGTESWIGDAAAQSVAIAGVTDAELEAAITAARAQWFSTVVQPGGGPIMHVPPSMVPRLVRMGFLIRTDKGIESTLEDPVVIGSGYDVTPPHVFFSGAITVRTTEPVLDENLVYARLNSTTAAADRLGLVDVAPCSIVRVGA